MPALRPTPSRSFAGARSTQRVAHATVLVWAAAILGASFPNQSDAPPRHAENLEFNRALGVECRHCHNPPASNEAEKATYLFARRMMRMVDGLNAGKLKDLGGITCWTCHRGLTKPGRLPRESWQALRDEHAAVFIGPRAERAVTMSVFAASLGVNCNHCHEVGNWEADTKAPKATAHLMLSLFEEIPTYFEPDRMPNLQCFLCHQGKIKPERQPAPGP